MEIQELFEFPFVDRTYETELLNNFFEQKEVNVLWINGKSGTGKSTFIKRILSTNINNKAYVCFSPNSENNACSLQQVVEELEKLSRSKFNLFIKKNYSSLFDITKQVTTAITSIMGINLSWFFNLLFDTSNQLISYKEEHENLSKVVNKYIESITKKKDICLIIDNFMYCDNASLDILLNIIKNINANKRVKIILITTTKPLSEKREIQIFLTEGIKSKYIELKKFDKFEYFIQILIHSFELDDNEIAIVKDIFNICSGTPESLKLMIRNLFLNGSIIIDSDTQKAKFKQNAIHNYLINQIAVVGQDNQIDFNSFTTIDQIILQIILILEAVLPMEDLISCAKIVNKKLFGDDLSYQIMERVLLLENIHIIKNEESRIAIYHDLLFYALSDYFKNSLISKQLSSIVLDYILDLSDEHKNLVLNHKTEYYIAKLSYLSRKNNWQSIVYEHFNAVFNRNEIFEAKKGFDWLYNYLLELPANKQLTIASCYYECGEYNNALTIIKHIEEHGLMDLDNLLYDYYFLKGKTENMLMQKINSVDSLKNAYSLSKTLDQKVLSLNMQQLVLMEIFGKRNEAKSIFDFACELIKKNNHYTLMSCHLLRNCMNFYKHDDAKWYFDIATNIAVSYNSNVDIAFVLNNKSFVDLKNGNIENAYEGFKRSKEILDTTKIHETSYPLVNMALCKLFEKKYDCAKELLLEALIWNHSPYIDYVIKIHLANCYYHLDDRIAYERISNKLYSVLLDGNIIDGTIIRKISINLAILFIKDNDIEKAIKCLDLAKIYVEGTSSEYRYNRIFALIHKDTFTDICPYCDYYSNTNFEPWGVTLSHD